jgi:hypothetical protein
MKKETEWGLEGGYKKQFLYINNLNLEIVWLVEFLLYVRRHRSILGANYIVLLNRISDV